MFLILFIIIVTLSVLLKFVSITPSRRNIIFLLIVLVLLSLFFGLRSPGSGVFYDYQSYKLIFLQADWSNIFFDEDIEPLFKLCCCVIKLIFGENQYVMFTFFGFLITSCFFISINKNSSDVYLAVILIVFMGSYFNAFNILRQFIAVAIYSLSIESLIKRKFKKYFLVCLIAGGFHASALFMISVYFIYNIKISGYMKYFFIVLAGIILAFSNYLFIALGRWTQYASYLDAEGASANVNIYTLVRPVFLILFMVYHIKHNFADMNNIRDKIVMFNLVIVLIISVISLRYAIAQRFIYFFLSVSLILFPDIIENRENKRMVAQWKMFIYCATFIYAKSGVFGLDYKFFWQ